MKQVLLYAAAASLAASAAQFALTQEQGSTMPRPVLSPPVAQDGRTLFQMKGCAHCHGANLAGTERGPSLQSVGLTATRARLHTQIASGSLLMPAFGDTLDDAELESLLNFLVTQTRPVRKPGSRSSR